MTPERQTPALPQTMILSYVTNVSTPTRVRIVAARVTAIAGWLNALAAATLICLIARDVYVRLRDVFGPAFVKLPTRVLWRSITFTIRMDDLFPACMAFLFAAASILLMFAAPAVRRGKAWACGAGLACFAIASLGGIAAGGGVGIYAFMAAGVIVPGRRDLPQFAWLLGAPVGALLCVVSHDMCRFLNWILRNPAAESPSASFLPPIAVPRVPPDTSPGRPS